MEKPAARGVGAAGSPVASRETSGTRRGLHRPVKKAYGPFPTWTMGRTAHLCNGGESDTEPVGGLTPQRAGSYNSSAQ
jgi:hypothetical protein